ncbi:hypothetical protein MSAN_00217800 [Mycena sanguinolenta]|uniref:Uncharacterized protein n=1 Tax=Mycena sanguinolenta TaxID=230812 RepID=A0A8H6ZI25_9AGAR|nr:hypothetical protein MSAN_00217800 [Mycena sanguinolenta]
MPLDNSFFRALALKKVPHFTTSPFEMLPSAGKLSCAQGYGSKCISDAADCDSRTACCDATQLPVNLARRAQNQHRDKLLRLWYVQKRHNPHQSLVPSHLNPLRALLPALDWNSTNTANRPFPTVGWNFQRPLSLPAEWRTRNSCDLAGERLSLGALFRGGLRYHCRVCRKDPLLKQLLLARHWAVKADAAFKSVASRMGEGDDDERDVEAMNSPENMVPRDLDDFDFDDGDVDWDERPLIDYHSPTPCYPLRLF